MVQTTGKTKKTEKEKNQLRLEYDYAQEYYSGLATIWKRDFITDADYQAFLRTYSFCKLDDVPQKFHKAIQYLKAMIKNHSELIRDYKGESNVQLVLPMA